jgi:hypothetical protein
MPAQPRMYNPLSPLVLLLALTKITVQMPKADGQVFRTRLELQVQP